jgi:hypothetical protein
MATLAIFRPRLIVRWRYWLRHSGRLRAVTCAASTRRSCYAGNQLHPVYHGEHGVRTLKELGRSYLTITQDIHPRDESH